MTRPFQATMARQTRIAAAVAIVCFWSSSAIAWSISGTVRDANGPLAGVAVSVKDTTSIKTTTDASGAFILSHGTVGVLSHDIVHSTLARIVGSDLFVEGVADGSVELTLVNASGRSLWNAKTLSSNGSARIALPSRMASGALFLRIHHAGGISHQAVSLGADGGLDIGGAVAARTQAAALPVLTFSLANYNDTTYAMTSDNQTGVTITMAKPVTCDLPTTFKWKDYGKPIAEPKNNWLAIKDFTMVRYNNQYIVYMTYTPQGGGFKGAYMAPFSDVSKAGDAAQAIMPNNLPGVAPELIYFTPKNTWVYTTQWCSTGSFCYTTGSDPTKPTTFAAQTKSLLTENITPNAPIDQVVICDDNNCYLFYADDKGNIYRGSMAKGSFPGNFTGTKKILSETDAAKLFEAVEVYKLKGQKKYLMIVECGYPRYFRAFTATDLAGTWTPIANTINAATPFAGPKNVTNGWSNDISHGEIVRTGYDEYREIDPCNLEMIYQGLTGSGDYNSLPYKMGHLTFTK